MPDNSLEDLAIQGQAFQPVSKLSFDCIKKSSDQAGRKGATAADKKSGNEGETPFRPRVTLPSHMEPTYYIGGGNNNALVEEVMNGLGWKRTNQKNDDSYKLKWCELKTSINYNTFKDGDQMVNHIPNCQLLTNKLGLLNSLQEYDRVCAAMKKRVPKLDFIPQTFRLDDPKDRDSLLEVFKDGDIWICKPTGRNQGKGIFLVRTREELEQAMQENDLLNLQLKEQGKPNKPLNRVIQQYIKNPMLLKGKKFDIRAYVLIASTTPYLVLFQKGYVRLSMFDYDTNCTNIATHLTNQFVQKKDPSGTYKDMKEDTVWTMDRFNEYVNENLATESGLDNNWVNTVLVAKMKHISTYCFNCVKHRLQCKTGYFDLYGLDFMIDEDMKVWLIEINVNPCLATNCEALKEVVPPVVKETIYLAIECFEKSRKGRSLMPLQSQTNFQIIHNGHSNFTSSSGSRSSRNTSPLRLQSTSGASTKAAAATAAAASTSAATDSKQRSRSLSPVRRARSLSPVKEVSHGSSDRTLGTGISNQSTLKSTPTVLPTIPAATASPYAHAVRLGSSAGQAANPATKTALLARNQASPGKTTSLGSKATPSDKPKQQQPGGGTGSSKDSVPRSSPHVGSRASPSNGTERLNKSPYKPDPVALKMTHASKNDNDSPPSSQPSSQKQKKRGKEDKAGRGS